MKIFRFIIFTGLIFNLNILRLWGIEGELFFNYQEYYKADIISNFNLTETPRQYFTYEVNLKLGIYNYYHGQLGDAYRYFSRALKLAGDSFKLNEASYWLGKTYFRQQKYEEASRIFSVIIPQSRILADDLLLFYGISLYYLGHFDEANNCLLNFYEKIKSSPQVEAVFFYLVLNSLARNDLEFSYELLRDDTMPLSAWGTQFKKYLKALTWYLEKDYEKSRNLLAGLIKENHDSLLVIRTRLLLGKIYFDNKNFKAALDELETVFEAATGNIKEYATLYLGLIYLKLGEPDKAISYFERLLDSNYEAYGFYYKARTYEKLREYRNAINEYKNLLAVSQNTKINEQGYYNLLELLKNHDNFQEFIPWAEDFLRNYPTSKYSERILYYLILSCATLNKYEKMEIYGERFLSLFTQSIHSDEVRFYLARVKEYRHRPVEALRYLSEIKDRKLYPYAQKFIGDIYKSLDSLDRALEAYVRAEKTGYDTLIDRVRFAQKEIAFQKGSFPSKLAMYEVFLAEYPQAHFAASLQYEIAESLFQRGDYQTALLNYKKVYQYRASHQLLSFVEWRKANCYEQLGEPDSAIVIYERIIKDFKDFPQQIEVLKRLAILYENREDYEKTIFYYNAIINSKVQSSEVEESYFRLADIYQKFYRYKDAQLLLKNFKREFPSSPRLSECYLMLSTIALFLGEYKEAEQTIKLLFEKFGKSGDGYFQLGKIKQAQSKYEEARKNFILASEHYLDEKESEKGARALWEAGLCALKERKYQEGETLFTRCMNLTVDERLRIRCQEQLQELRKP
jgi:tetratricopeptide (TPR) repeat protein